MAQESSYHANKYLHANKYFHVNKYFKALDNDRLQCNLCPHNCVLHPDKIGLCNTRKNIRGKLYSLAYGRPCSINIDPVEKKPLYHFFPGKKILSLGTFGCNLFCKGCQNYDISRSDAQTSSGTIQNPEDIIELAKKNGLKLIAYTYNEPTIFFEYMLDTAKLAKKNGIKNVIVSNGYINEEPLKELLKYIDAANIDLKGFTGKFYKEYAKASLEPVLNTIKIINQHNKKSKHKVWLELTNLIIPGLNDDMPEIKNMCDWIAKVNKNIPLHFSRFFPYYEAEQIEMTPEITLLKARDIAKKAGLKYVYIGNLGINDNTYCAECDSLLIERQNYNVNILGLIGPNRNKCKKCGTVLDGIF
jgi:pyruvate formate lyase activating enzyme